MADEDYQKVYLPAGLMVQVRMCRRCGCLLPLVDPITTPSPTPEEAHDALHDLFAELVRWQNSAADWAAEQLERGDG